MSELIRDEGGSEAPIGVGTPEYWGLAAEVSETGAKLEAANGRRLRGEQERAQIIQRLKAIQAGEEEIGDWDVTEAVKANDTELFEAERIRDELRIEYGARLRMLDHQSGLW